MAKRSVSISLTGALLTAGRAFVFPRIPSRTLRNALTTYQTGNRGYMNVPHYWAIYYHEGHTRPIIPRTASMLVWYKNPAQDPRLSGGYPVRRSQVRKLTSAEFKRDRAAGKLIVTKRSPYDGRPVRGRRFFANDGGMSGFVPVANRVVARTATRGIVAALKKRGLYNTTIVQTIRIGQP